VRRASLFVAMLLLLAIITRIQFAFVVVVFVALVTFAMWLFPVHAGRHLTISRSVARRIFHGESTEVVISVENDGWLPVPWVTLHDRAPLDLSTPEPNSGRRRVVSPGPGETIEVRYKLRGRRRGYHAIGPLEAVTGDLLGLAERGLARIEPDFLTVYPKIVPLASLGLPTRSPHALLKSHVPLFHDPTRLAGTRSYRSGDARRSIHWKATARTGNLMVKQFDPAIARDTVVCLDLDRRHYDARRRSIAPELAVTVAASIAHHVVTVEAQPVGLLTRAYDPLVARVVDMVVAPASDQSQLLRILELLARATAAPDQPIDDLLAAAGGRLPWGASLVVITGSLYDGLAGHLARLARSGFAVSVVLVKPAGSGPGPGLGSVGVHLVDSEVVVL